MKFKKINGGYIIKVEKGEEIVTAITQFCESNKIESGNINGIGGTDSVCIHYYDLKKKEYVPKTFSGKNYEIISLNGNIALLNGKPFAHIHIALGDADYNMFGGHLKSAVIAVTGEITISMTGDTIGRHLDDESQLNLLDI